MNGRTTDRLHDGPRPLRWRRLPFETGPAARLLNDGVALLDGLADDPVPALRWYRSEDTALVLGRGQPATLVRQDDLPVVGRFSGGGAVLMDPGLLCLDLLLPTGHPLLAGDLGAPFHRIGAAWAGALQALGVPGVGVHTAPAAGPPRTTARGRLIAAVCYATLGRGEVTVGGRKIVGLAQRRRRAGALVQCGLLRRWEPGPLLRALGAPADDSAIVAAAAGLDDLMTLPPTDEEVQRAVELRLEWTSEHA